MITTTLILLQLAAPPQAPAPREDPLPAAFQNPGDIQLYWKHGLRFETADKSVQGKIGGRIHWDVATVANDSYLNAAGVDTRANEGTEFRRTRIYTSGVLDGHLEWKAQFDFASGSAVFKDMYLGFRDIADTGIGVRAGQFKEPFSLEELTSSNYITFQERSLANVFAPARSTGAMAYGAYDEDFTWAFGLFRDSDAQGMANNADAWHATGRVTGVPWSENDDARLLHLGVATSWQDPNNGAGGMSYRVRPESHLASRFIVAPVGNVDTEQLYGVEAALVYDQFSVQGEFMSASADLVGGGSIDGTAWYVEGSWFLTGEHRIYDRKHGAFKATDPDTPLFGEGGGGGAWQLRARWSAVDLSDAFVGPGGELTDVTVGVTWFLNYNMRLMAEVINADLDGIGETLIGQGRMQIFW